MPIYEYKCPKCDTSIDIKRDVDDRDKVAKCPKCKKPMERQISAPGLRFIGSGFYENDYKKKN